MPCSPGLPDIPLTSLKLVLNGGAEGMFLTNCNPGNGVADAASTDQNGDKTVSTSIDYDISGCAASSGHDARARRTPTRAPTLSASRRCVAGFKSGHPSLTFRVSARKHAAKLTQLTVKLSSGLNFVKHRVGKRMKVTGVSLTGAKIKSLAISHGRLVIKLRKAVASFRVKLTSVLHERQRRWSPTPRRARRSAACT